MPMFILLIILCALYVISALSYWCLHKHWGTVGLYCAASYMIAACYVFLMSTYLFDSDTLLYVILFAMLLLFVIAALFFEHMLLIERPMQLIFSGVTLSLNMLLLLYANLLLGWETITMDYFFHVCLIVGISTGTIAGLLFEGAFIHFSTKCFYVYEQFLKFLIGLLVSFFIIFILYQFENMPIMSFILSFLFSFWICGLFPILIKKIQRYEYRSF